MSASRAIKENIVEYLFAKFGLSQNKSSMIHKTIAKLGQGIHFRGQNRHWSLLTGALVAGSYIMGHLSTDFTCYMLNHV